MADANVIHFEIVGKDQEALQRYYGDLFGWKINNDFPGGYGMTDAADTGVVVGIGSAQDGASGHVTGYITVADINATLEKATALGGSVDHAALQPRRDGPPGARRRPRRPRPGPHRTLIRTAAESEPHPPRICS